MVDGDAGALFHAATVRVRSPIQRAALDERRHISAEVSEHAP